MDTLSCPQCGNSVNANSPICPNCGHNLVNTIVAPQNFDKTKSLPPRYQQKGSTKSITGNTNTPLWVVIAVLATIIVMGCAFLLWQHMQPPKETQPAVEKETTPPETVYVKQETKTIVVPTQKNVSFYGDKTLVGTIGKYAIRMNINISPDGTVEGTYTYLKQGNWLHVYGTYEKGEITLEEFTPKGNNTGCFFGSYTGTAFTGTFRNYAHNASYSFSVSE